MAIRNYSSTAQAKTLGGSGITDSSQSLNISEGTSTLPGTFPFTLVIAPDTALEEVVTVTGAASGNIYPVMRGQDGTQAIAHNAGDVIKHMITPRDLQEPQNHMEATQAYTIKNDGANPSVTTATITKTLHGIASGEGNVVGTDKTQTLKNKTLSGAGAGANTFTAIPQASVTDLVSDLAAKTTALTAHEADTTAIHGIADTSKLPRIASASAGRTMFVQAAQPTALAVGDIWFQVTGL